MSKEHFAELSSRVTEGNESAIVSIVILTCNELANTRLCLQTLQENTTEAYDLIIVDNASTDGTLKFLHSLPRPTVLVNAARMSWAASYNRGFLCARSKFIVLLRADSMVTDGWLGRMLAVWQRDPGIGIVLPYVSPRQEYPEYVGVPADDDAQQQQTFARERAVQCAGQGREVDRAESSCLLINRAVVDKIGGLDARFADAELAADDFCLRARLAGFKIWLASDALVHSRGLYAATGEMADPAGTGQSWARFKAKWLLPPDLPRERSYAPARLLEGQFDWQRHFVPFEPAPPAETAHEYQLFNRFLGCYSRHDYPGAVDVARLILEDLDRTDSPYRDDEILFFLGNGFASVGEYDQAQTCYQACFALAEQRYQRGRHATPSPSDPHRFLHMTSVLANNLALLDYARGRFDEAARTLKKAGESAVKNEALALNSQAMDRRQTRLYLQELQGHTRPLPVCQQVLAERWREAGLKAFQGEQILEALRCFQAVCATLDAGPQDLHDLGMALARAARHQEALDAFIRALEMDPCLPVSYMNVGYALFNLGDQITAEKFLLKAHAFDPTLQHLQDNLADVRARMAERAGATSSIRYSHLDHWLEKRRPPRLSLCMIVKDEERYLAECLRSAQAVVDEMIVVDTGSTDNTVAVARSCGARIFHFPWQGDFAAARNESLRHATGDWILILDADERLDPAGYSLLRALIARTDIDVQRPVIYVPMIVNYRGEGDILENYMPRLFPRLPNLTYRGRIHEFLDGPVQFQRVRDLIIHHRGYHPGIMDERRKWKRNLDISLQAAAEEPTNHFLQHNLGNLFLMAGEWQKARQYYERAVDLGRQKGASLDEQYYLPDCFNALATCCRNLGDMKVALDYAGQGLALQADHPGLLITQGQIHFEQEEYPEAIDCYGKALELQDKPLSTYSSVARAQVSWLPLLGIGDAWAALGERNRAMEAYQQAQRLAPDHPLVATRIANLSGGTPAMPSPVPLPAQADEWRVQGFQSYEAGNYLAALPWFKHVTETPWVRARDYHNLGATSYRLGDYQAALDAYLQALALAPAHAHSYNYVGTALYNLGDLFSAQRFFDRARQLNPYVKEIAENAQAVSQQIRQTSCLELRRRARGHRSLLPLLAGPPPPRLSLCMIVKNEEQLLADCLQSAQPVVDEMIVVDTGSTDNTVAVARDHGARIYHYPWQGDFSAARNESLHHATGDWILILDADERLRTESYAALRDAIALTPVVTDAPTTYLLKIVNFLAPGSPEVMEHYTLRLFPNLPQLRFSGYVHEQLPLTGRRQLYLREIAIDHHGYEAAMVEGRHKIPRNRELLERAVAEQPDDPFHHFNLSMLLANTGDFEPSLQHMEQALELQARTRIPYVWRTDAYDMAAYCSIRLRRPDAALSYCEQGLAIAPDYAGLWVSMGQAYLDKQEYDIALACFQKARSLEGVAAMAGLTYLRDSTWVPLFGMGVAYCRQGRLELARKSFDQALVLSPDNPAILEQVNKLPAAGTPSG